ncbi:hypothetical protein GEMRC1_013060 [Eukaryota sp. GEM-RC1]
MLSNFSSYLPSSLLANAVSIPSSSKTMPYQCHSDQDRQEMLKSMNMKSVDDLFAHIPDQMKIKGTLRLPEAKSEFELISDLKKTCKRTQLSPTSLPSSELEPTTTTSLLPSITSSPVLSSSLPTPPTPPNQICLLTGMEISNASMYDGPTSTAEAIALACRQTKRRNVLLAGNLHPSYANVAKTYSKYSDKSEITHLPVDLDNSSSSHLIDSIDRSTSCVVVQYPGVTGAIPDLAAISKKCKETGTFLIVAVNELLSLGSLESPGKYADIVVGDGGSLAGGVSFGGPSVGFFATKKKFLRQLPGRLVGETKDKDGKRCFALTVATREQHIKREKATSNICTSAGIMALSLSIHLSMLGEHGFKSLAEHNHQKCCYLVDRLKGDLILSHLGLKVVNDSFFNEVLVKLPNGVSAKEVVERLARRDVLAGCPMSRLFGDDYDNYLLLAVTEKTSESDVNALVSALPTAF